METDPLSVVSALIEVVFRRAHVRGGLLRQLSSTYQLRLGRPEFLDGLAAGADDYVVKPFSVAELAARLHALVRLHEEGDQRPLVVGDLAIEPRRRLAGRRGRQLELTSREFDLLLALARHSGQVLTRGQLLEQVWGYTWEVESNVVDVFVGYLRKKLESAGEHRVLHTVRGVGFVLRV